MAYLCKLNGAHECDGCRSCEQAEPDVPFGLWPDDPEEDWYGASDDEDIEELLFDGD